MANLAVVFYSDLVAESRKGPDDWPAYVREIGAQSTYSESPYIWSVMSIDDYNTYRADHYADYQSWVSAHPGSAQLKALTQAIENAKNFGRKLQSEYAAENVLGGITTAQVDSLVILLAPLISLLDSGSLNTAYEKALDIPIDQHPFWTADTRDHLRQHIYNYLNGLADDEMD